MVKSKFLIELGLALPTVLRIDKRKRVDIMDV